MGNLADPAPLTDAEISRLVAARARGEIEAIPSVSFRGWAVVPVLAGAAAGLLCGTHGALDISRRIPWVAACTALALGVGLRFVPWRAPRFASRRPALGATDTSRRISRGTPAPHVGLGLFALQALTAFGYSAFPGTALGIQWGLSGLGLLVLLMIVLSILRGRMTLRWDRDALTPGAKVRFQIGVSDGAATVSTVRCLLECVRMVPVWGGLGVRATVIAQVASDPAMVPAVGPGSDMVFDVRIPPDVPPSGAADRHGFVAWRCAVFGRIGRWPYQDRFEVPVASAATTVARE